MTITKDAKNINFVALVLAIACGAAGVVIMLRQKAKDAVVSTAKVVRQSQPIATTDVAPPGTPRKEVPPAIVEALAPSLLAPAAQGAPSAIPLKANAKVPSPAGPTSQGVRPPKAPLQDPLAIQVNGEEDRSAHAGVPPERPTLAMAANQTPFALNISLASGV